MLGALFVFPSLISATLRLGSLAILATHGLDGVKESEHQKKEEVRMRELEADRLVRAEEKKAVMARMEREAAARADRSIDIAGHMQKYAEADTIFIGKHVIEEMRTSSDFQPVERQVDGCDVYAWRSN